MCVGSTVIDHQLLENFGFFLRVVGGLSIEAREGEILGCWEIVEVRIDVDAKDFTCGSSSSFVFVGDAFD